MKIDIAQTKSILLSPKQYENFKPTISVTLKEIPVDSVDSANAYLDDICETLFKMEIASQYYIYKKIGSDGLDKFCSDILENVDSLIEGLEFSMNGLIEISRNKENKF